MKDIMTFSYILTLCLIFMLIVAMPMMVSAGVIEKWVARYNGPGNYRDYALAMAIDSAGNVYVSGRSELSGTDPDYATVKYDTEGNELWVARYNGPGNSYDIANAIAIDSAGNVYVTGYSDGIGTNYDYATVKYFDCLYRLGKVIKTLEADGMIPEGIKNSLLSQVENASKSAANGNICAAVNEIQALINEVNALRSGNQISDEAADMIIDSSNDSINCLLEVLPTGETC